MAHSGHSLELPPGLDCFMDDISSDKGTQALGCERFMGTV